MGTTSGQEAFKYLRDKAARLGTVVVKTNKIDIYGRYLVDIFYPVSKANNQTTQAEIFNQGVYLNEELVKKGFAKVV
jgi:endonuclease YncB( thermonuclease family)